MSSDTFDKLPEKWESLRFEPKKSRLVEASTDADALKAILEADEDEFMPWEDVVLPSEGLYYDGEVPGGIVQVRPMGLAADKILATQRLAQTGKSLDYLFKKCVRFPTGNFDPTNLLAGDRTFLLYYLRGITHGNIYEFIVECSNSDCEQPSTHEYDLNDLRYSIEGPNEALGEEPFKVVLPRMSEVVGRDFWVKVRFLRGYDTLSMTSTMNRKKRIRGQKIKKSKPGQPPVDIDETISQSLYLIVDEVMGSRDKNAIKNIIDKLHSTDSAVIREFLKKNAPGLDTQIKIDCPECGNTMKVDLPITESFFRPPEHSKQPDGARDAGGSVSEPGRDDGEGVPPSGGGRVRSKKR